MPNTDKQCQSCHGWHHGDDNQGQCRKHAPHPTGWPNTTSQDWCLEWTPKQVPPKAPAVFKASDTSTKPQQICINYVFVRDYPRLATEWLQAATADPDAIPLPLRPVLAEPLAGILSAPLPEFLKEGECCERILNWGDKLPGSCNDGEEEGAAEYVGILITTSETDEITDSQAAMLQIPNSHPWRALQVALG